MSRPFLGFSQYKLASAFSKPLYFQPPLGLERSRTDNKNPGYVGVVRKQFGNSYPLDCFAQPHVVCNYSPAHAHRKCNAVKLIRKQFCF